MVDQILGVCCSCQSVHPVHPFPPNGTELGIHEDDPEEYWVMASHRTQGDTGPWCEGEGTTPQALVNPGGVVFQGPPGIGKIRRSGHEDFLRKVYTL